MGLGRKKGQLNKKTLRKIRLRGQVEKTKAKILARQALQGVSVKVEDNPQDPVHSSHGTLQVLREEEIKTEPEENSNSLQEKASSSFFNPKSAHFFPNESIKARKISSEGSGSKYVLFTPSKSRTAEKPRCFVCESPTSSAENKRIPQEIFQVLLEDILELPLEVIQDYSNQCGGVHQWIHLCQACLNEVTEARHIRQQILHLEKRFLKKQIPVVKKIKNGSLMNPDGVAVLEEIRKYVYQREYEENAEQKLRNQHPSRIIERPGIAAEGKLESHIHLDTADDEEVPVDINEFASTSSKTNPVQVTGSDGVPVYFCGLCDEFRGFSSEKGLTSHQNEAHWASADGERDEKVAKAKQFKNSRYVYSCPRCPQVKNYSITRYAQHLAFHLRRPYKCSECLEFLPEDSDLRDQHWKDRHGDKQEASEKFIKVKLEPGQIWKCQGCLEGFLSERERNTHQIECGKVSKERKTLINCSTCSMRFQGRNEWRLHRLLIHPEVDSISCLFCDESFAAGIVDADGVIARNDYKMLEHIKSVHELSENGRKGIPLYHRRAGFIHEECEQCGITLSARTKSLSEHLEKTHGRPKTECEHPFQCNYCPKRFSQLQYIRSHMAKYHFRSEEAICEVCGTEVISRDKLLHHKFTQHGIVPEGMKVLECTEPGCTFKALEQFRLRNHSRAIHYNKRHPNYVCKYCGKPFKNKTHFVDHINSHENKESKPFQCEICGNSFAVKNYLYIHKRLTHEKRFFPSTNKKKRPREKSTPAPSTASSSQTREVATLLAEPPLLTEGCTTAGYDIVYCPVKYLKDN